MSRYNQQHHDQDKTSDDIKGPTVRLIKHKGETDKAILFSVDTAAPTFWLPKSEIVVMPTPLKHIKMVKVSQWLADKNRLTQYAE